MSREEGELLAGAGPADPYGRLAPDPEILLAIALAVEECWPRPLPERSGGSAWNRRTSAWRFSGRSWTGPALLRRQRPGS